MTSSYIFQGVATEEILSSVRIKIRNKFETLANLQRTLLQLFTEQIRNSPFSLGFEVFYTVFCMIGHKLVSAEV